MVLLATMKNPSWSYWHPLKQYTCFSWQPWQDHAGTFFMESIKPFMFLGYGCQEKSTWGDRGHLMSLFKKKEFLLLKSKYMDSIGVPVCINMRKLRRP